MSDSHAALTPAQEKRLDEALDYARGSLSRLEAIRGNRKPVHAGGFITESNTTRKFIREAREHTLAAADTLHELMMGPEKLDPIHLELALQKLRMAVQTIELATPDIGSWPTE
jgi:hypothetical protein